MQGYDSIGARVSSSRQHVSHVVLEAEWNSEDSRSLSIVCGSSTSSTLSFASTSVSWRGMGATLLVCHLEVRYTYALLREPAVSLHPEERGGC